MKRWKRGGAVMVDKEKLAKEVVDAFSRSIDSWGHEVSSAVVKSCVNECSGMIEEGRIVDAIKHCRNCTGAGLKEAKEMIDKLGVLLALGGVSGVSKREVAKDEYVSAIDKLRGDW